MPAVTQENIHLVHISCSSAMAAVLTSDHFLFLQATLNNKPSATSLVQSRREPTFSSRRARTNNHQTITNT